MQRIGLAMVLAMIAGCSGMPGAASGDVELDEAAIWNGTPTSDFPAVGALVADGGAFCTGTLVAPDVVLTAAHCTEFMDGHADADMRFATGPGAPGVLEGGIPLNDWLAHPEYDGWNADIGLAFLDDVVDMDPTWILADEMHDSEWIGRIVTLVGYGITGDGLYDSGEKLETEVEVYAFDDDVFFHYTAGTNACFGDSGGPALYELDDGWRAVGVLSAVFPHLYEDQICVGGGGYQVRVDLYVDWIEEYAEVNVEPADDDDDDVSEADDDDTSLDDGSQACQCMLPASRTTESKLLLTLLLLAWLRVRRRDG